MAVLKTERVILHLSMNDRAALLALYRFRCLDESTLAEFYKTEAEGNPVDFTRNRLTWFWYQEMIMPMRGCGLVVFFLTTRGIHITQLLPEAPEYFSLPHNKVTGVSIMMAPATFQHQLALSRFALGIEQKYALGVEHYKDSKFASNFTYAQPDGVFEFPHMDIFLEMDMCTEPGRELGRKWRNYRNYLNSREYYLARSKPFTILFATENTPRIYQRRETILRSISTGILDIISPSFDCYVGLSEYLTQIAGPLIRGHDPDFTRIQELLSEKFSFRFSYPKSVAERCGEQYCYMNSSPRNGVPAQAFFLENGLAGSINSLKRAVFYPRTSSILFPSGQNIVPLLLVVSSPEQILRDLKAFDALGTKNVCFTTEKRLTTEGITLPEAVFQFDKLGNRYHFSDYTYSQPVHERKG